MFMTQIYTPAHNIVNTHMHSFKEYYAFMYKSTYYEIALNAAKVSTPQLLKKDGELNVSRLAEISGITQPTLKRIFDGEIQQPKADTLKKLGKALKISWGPLVDGGESKEASLNQAQQLAKKLIGKTTPRSLDVIRRIEKAASDGLLKEEDLVLLDAIARRFTDDKST